MLVSIRVSDLNIRYPHAAGGNVVRQISLVKNFIRIYCKSENDSTELQGQLNVISECSEQLFKTHLCFETMFLRAASLCL